MDPSEKFTFSFTLLLVVVIIASSLIIFILTPSPISPTRLLFGYITGVYTKNKTVYLEFDPAAWLTDDKPDFPASTACIKDGKCPGCSLPVKKTCVPNGYYIKNPEHNIVTYPVVPFAKVGTLILNPDWNQSDPQSKPYKTISLSEFTNIFLSLDSPHSWIKTASFDITAIAGKAIIINQHYLP